MGKRIPGARSKESKDFVFPICQLTQLISFLKMAAPSLFIFERLMKLGSETRSVSTICP